MATDIQTVAIAQGAAGSTELVAAVAGKSVEVLAFHVTLDAAGTAKFRDGDTDLTGAVPLPTNGQWAQQANFALFRTGAGEALNIVSGTGKAFGYATYRVVG